jgi:hypothetical protein
MEPLSGFRAFSMVIQGRTVPGVEAGRFNPGLDYGILSGFPAIADATFFVAPYRVKEAAKQGQTGGWN